MDTLVFYANIYTNPTKDVAIGEEWKLRTQASDALRQKATLILSRKTRIRLYSVATFFGAIPTENAIDEAHKDLIFLSNSCFRCNPIGTSLVSDRIVKLLTSGEIPPKVPPQDLAIV